MSKNNKQKLETPSEDKSLELSGTNTIKDDAEQIGSHQRKRSGSSGRLATQESNTIKIENRAQGFLHHLLIGGGILTIVSLLSIGVLARLGVLPGRNIISSSPSSIASSLQPVAVNPLPTATAAPRLAKEYVYAGSRMLTVEDAGAGNSGQGTDLVVWRLSSGTWFVKDGQNPNAQFTSVAFGQSGDVPTPADFDGDSLADFCVYRPNSPSAGLGNWFIQGSTSSAFQSIQFGSSSDKPAPADFDGDGRADIAVWRSSTATFYILQSNTNTVQSVTLGQSGDTPTPADFDGDGRADAATFRESSGMWTIKQSSNNQTRTETWGASGDKAAIGDYDGDGKTDLATWRGADLRWRVKYSSNGAAQPDVYWGASGDILVQGDYDADGRTDIATWRPGNGYWYIIQSSTNQPRSEQWGGQGDIPVPAPMRR